MPVTIDIAPHGANPVRQSAPHSSEALLLGAAPAKRPVIGTIIQSSFSHDSRAITPCDNGLVRTAFQAYTSHHHLVLRPEDIWFAILSQFSFYVNAHAETLRHKFVAHEGKLGLVLKQTFEDLDAIDYGDMCINMTRLIETVITDPTLRAWIMPSWTTTTREDTIIASVYMMGTLQRYFEYVFDPACCGIPTVTLLGERADWADLATRVERLGEYGDEPALFLDLLRPIVRGFLETFDAPHDEHVRDFWSRVIDYQSGSGMNHLSGWITAFLIWDEDGKFRIEKSMRKKTKAAAAGQAEAAPLQLHPLSEPGWAGFRVDLNEVPSGFVSVPVKLKDPETYLMVDTELLAGSIGMEAVTAADMGTWWADPAEPKAKPAGTQQHGDHQEGRRLRLSTMAQRLIRTVRCGRQDAVDDDPPSASTDADSSMTNSTLVADKDKTTTNASTYPSLKHTPPSPSDPPSTVKPVTGWWMYEVKGGELAGKNMSLREFLESRKSVWTGQVTGTVEADGSLSVERDW
ncbi:hypothetical protein F5Y10DRAFT_258754 [Nemania abortiva]|nr:hypothetical protein F5Y10DRAFT_258754 [Nemania abortiva]